MLKGIASDNGSAFTSTVMNARAYDGYLKAYAKWIYKKLQRKVPRKVSKPAPVP
jgi:hypothetical protein